MSTHRPLHLPCLVVLTLLATTSDARLYRWVDEAGAVHYTDTLPPAQAERGHAEMSEKGLVVDTTERAKTPEELQREEEAKRARLAAERAKKEQEAADQMLLRTFGSVDDMIMTRDGRLAAVDAMIRLTRGNIRRQQDLLRKLRADMLARDISGYQACAGCDSVHRPTFLGVPTQNLKRFLGETVVGYARKARGVVVEKR